MFSKFITKSRFTCCCLPVYVTDTISLLSPSPFSYSLSSGRAYRANFVRLDSSMTTITLNLYCICYFYFASRLDCYPKQHNMLPFNFKSHLHSFFSLPFSLFLPFYYLLFFFGNSYINGASRIRLLKTSAKRENDATDENLILQLFLNCLLVSLLERKG